MSPLRPSSNVYVLRAPLSAETPTLRPRPRLSMRLRGLAWWWRLRLTVREVTDALRRFGRSRSRVELDELGLDAEPSVVTPPRRSAGPAQVIEFSAARRRRSAR
jgi:hypothetical protein